MIKSMTGYGRASRTLNGRKITIEIRAVNNRYLDCSVKMPRIWLFAEDALKKRVQKYVARGKVDVFVSVDISASDAVNVTVNRPLAAGYIRALNELMNMAIVTPVHPDYDPGHVWNAFDLAYAAARFPDVISIAREEEDFDGVTADLCAVLDDALSAFNTMRETEGARLAEDISRRLDTIERETAVVEERSPRTVEEYRAKLLRRLQEALKGVSIDEQRVLTEAAIYADKVAVDEETVRLRSHIAQLRELLQADASQGKKMDFLTQEMNRETNTIGSKCADVSIAQTVVRMKAEVEKIREQVQNVE